MVARRNRRRSPGSPSRRRAESSSARSALSPSSLSFSSNGLLASAALVASVGVLGGGASAFRLTSLLPFWGEYDTDGGVDASSSSFDENDPLGALAYPRRNLAAEFGEERYRSKIAEALGEKSGGGGGGGEDRCEEGAAECPAGGGGIDLSFPAHHARPSALSTERREFYDAYVKGCRDRYPSSKYGSDNDDCGQHESDRLDMNRNQPRIMRNYTDVGFLKTKAPNEMFIRLRNFWKENRNKNRKREKWGRGDTFVNHWEVPTYMIDLGDPDRVIGGMDMRNAVWQGAREVLSRWTGQRDLTASSLYGIRVYERGAVLAPHVDRLPLVTSGIINVDQDVDEPWPLEVIAHDGRAYNVTLEPGEMLLYESHSVVHGRPYPLRGNYYANVFVHFEPRGHTQRHGERMEAFMRDGKVAVESDEELYRRAMEKAEAERKIPKRAQVSGSEGVAADDLPDYIARGTPEEKRWKQQFVKVNPGTTKTTVTLDEALGGGKGKSKHHADNAAWGGNAAHRAASTGDYDAIRDIAASSEQRHLLFKQDKNGWQPLHEAARGGYTRIVELLLDEGADVNARTNQGRGGNALWWAEKTHGKNHPVSKLLRKRGGKSEAPKKAA